MRETSQIWTLAHLKQLFQESFRQFIDSYTGTPGRLHEAMRYALEGEGKRVRPLLCLSSAVAVGGDPRQAMAAAIAIEMIHTYSLIHDDLPAMDNDDLRRGRPTLHRAYDEATAILVGDALLTDAIGLVTQPLPIDRNQFLSPQQPLALVQELVQAAGSLGMVQGQALDIAATGKNRGNIEDLDRLHRLKTGALLGASCAAGALSVLPAPCPESSILRVFGQEIGLAFQILDDLIDPLSLTGKTAHKDANAGKFTYLTILPPNEAKLRAEIITQTAISQLPAVESYNDLREFACALLNRQE